MNFYKTLRFFCAPIVRVLWPTKIIGAENLDRISGGLLICNHYSKVDGVLPVAYLFKEENHVLIKSEAFRSKIGNWFLRKIGGIPVNRGEADIDAVKEILKVLKDDKKLLLFPEGTRNKTGSKEMLEFKKGTARFAIKTQKPVIPMMYYKPPKVFSRNYLYIGEPLDMSSFYSCRKPAEYEAATQFLFDKMVETRAKLDAYVEEGGRG